MHKKTRTIDAYDISEEEYLKLCNQPTARRVIEAVTSYNELVSLSGYGESKNTNELLIKQAEEEATKAFLDGVFDIIQNRES